MLMSNPAVSDLLARSNRLGADPRNTNYAGGNTSAKGTEIDPVTAAPTPSGRRDADRHLAHRRRFDQVVCRIEAVRRACGGRPGLRHRDLQPGARHLAD